MQYPKLVVVSCQSNIRSLFAKGTNVMAWVTIEAAATARRGAQKVCRPFFELIWQDSPNRKETPVTERAMARKTTGIDQPAA